MRLTDMADELYAAPACSALPGGVRVATARHDGVTMTRVEIAREGLERPRGRYVTLEVPRVSVLDERDSGVIEQAAAELRALLPPEGPVLVLGVGQFIIRNGNIRMAVEVCFRHILFPEQGYLIILCNDLFSIRIIDSDILTPAIAGVAYCKMRSRLLRDQDRQLVLDAIFSSHHIGSRIRANGKFTHRKCLMIMQYMVCDIFLTIFFIIKITATVICDLAIQEIHFQIQVLQFTQIYLCHMQLTIRSL